MASILEFKSNLLGGGARANQFKVYLQFPTIVTGTTDAARKSEFLCTAASLPGSNVEMAVVQYRGRAVKLAGERQFANWNVTVINDTDFSIRNAVEKWMNAVNNVQTNQGTTNPLAYTAQLEVNQLDRNGGVLKKYKILDAWPTNLSEIALSFDANNQVEQFNIEFAYGWWEAEDGAGVSASAGGFSVGI